MAEKKPQNWEGKSVFTENQLSRNEVWCAVSYNYMYYIFTKGFLDSKFN